MGEVYRARDTRLDREVAIKVLPELLARDPERLARFEREAKTLASLNHPNIAQIYGLEETGDTRALVMELIPGAPVPLGLQLVTAIGYARQIAAALEAAHSSGVVHRDLKPANILVTPGGVIKILDFGLAAVIKPPAESGTEAQTVTVSLTQMGTVMGTPAYMSPEQARGRSADPRSDIWSFGVILFEMLTAAPCSREKRPRIRSRQC
jgi:serine/threonine protein kinase